VFDSLAANLVVGDSNQIDDVFVRDRQAGTTERVSVAADGSQGNGQSSGPAISADGRFVAFTSLASNLVPGDSNGATDVFVRDRLTGATERVSVDSHGQQGNAASGSTTSAGVAVSSDGRLVAFTSTASNLVAGDSNSATDVFVRDRLAATTARVSVATDGTQANDASTDPAVSGDGTLVVFFSAASNLVARDSNSCDFPAVSFTDGHCPDLFAHTG
jgi:Tol biopolymer transport system component